MFQGSLKGVSRYFQECFKKVSKVFQGRLSSAMPRAALLKVECAGMPTVTTVPARGRRPLTFIYR